jgi:hypothetical protein
MGHPNLTLKITAQRIIDGTDPQFAIKEHIDEWNRSFDPALYAEEPPLTVIEKLSQFSRLDHANQC